MMATELSYGQYLLYLFNDFENPLELKEIKDMPKKDANISDEDERKLIWKLKMNEWDKRRTSLTETLRKIYLGVWGQCTKTLQILIDADADYDTKKNEHDPVYLLSTIRKLMTGVDKKRNMMKIYYKKLRKLFLF